MPENAQSEKATAVEPSSKVSPPLEHAPTQQPQPQPFNVEEIKKHIPKAFHGYIEPIIQWAQSVEARFKAIETELPNTVKTKMAEAIEEARAKAQAPAAGREVAQAGGQQDLSGIIDMVSKVLGEGGGQAAPNPFAQKAQELALKGMEESVSFTSMLNSYMKQKLAQNIVKEVIEKALP